MLIRSKILISVIGISCCILMNAEEKKEEADAVIEPKLIKLNVKKVLRTRKIKKKAKGKHAITAGRIDHSHDDKKDNVTITIDIENKNRISIKNYKLFVSIYAISVAEKKAKPEEFENFTNSLDELKPKAKLKKEFNCTLIYDKSADKVRRATGNYTPTSNVPMYDTVGEVPPFGSKFYGYTVELKNEEDKVVFSTVWPAKLKKEIAKPKK